MTTVAAAVRRADRLPAAELDVLARFVADAYDLPAVLAARSMGSELDLTLVLDGADGPFAVLKHTGLDGEETVARQIALLEHLHAGSPLPVPVVIRARDGRALVPYALGDRDGVVAITTFSEGSALEDVELEAELVADIGRTLAALQTGLVDFPGELPRDHGWNLDAAPSCAPLVEVHLEPELRGYARALLEEFGRFADTVRPMLPMQAIHADFNLSNVLTDGRRVTGVIDFGDAVHAPRVYDLAIALSYLGMPRVERAAELRADVLAAYRPEPALHPAERDALPLLVAVRTLMAVVLGREHARRHPERAAYALRYDAIAARALFHLAHADAPRPLAHEG